MDGAPISALAALAGSIIGGVTALGTSWLTQQAQARTRENAEDRTAREALYSDFIVEASRLFGDAWVNDKPEMSNLIGLYAMVSRMRVRSSSRVIENAEKVARTIVETYFAPNRSLRELRDMLDSESMDPLRGFSEACREELRSLRAGAGVPGFGIGRGWTSRRRNAEDRDRRGEKDIELQGLRETQVRGEEVSWRNDHERTDAALREKWESR